MRRQSATQAQLQRVRALVRSRTLRVSYLLPQDEKRSWGQGPWIDEPDMVRWIDKHSGMPCIVARHCDTGNLCGYVGVSADHLMYGVEYKSGLLSAMVSLLTGETPKNELTPHAGVTWSNYCPWDTSNEEHWYFGYDCGHASDYKPAQAHRLQEMFVQLRQECPEIERLHAAVEKMRMIHTLVVDPAEDTAEAALIDAILRPVYRPMGYCINQCARLASQLICSPL